MVSNVQHPFSSNPTERGAVAIASTPFPSHVRSYVSFAYSDAPPSEPGSESWMRIGYTRESDAMPMRFDPVQGQKDTYTLFNMWPQHQQYIKTSGSPNYWLQAFADPGEGGTPIKFVPTGNKNE